MNRTERIRYTLKSALSPTLLEVEDESASHADHREAMPGGESHYHVTIAAPGFSGLSRVEAHRRVKKALAEEFEGGLHALRITVKDA